MSKISVTVGFRKKDSFFGTPEYYEKKIDVDASLTTDEIIASVKKEFQNSIVISFRKNNCTISVKF